MSEKSTKLKVEGLSQDVTVSQLTLILCNKRRRGGGPINNIELSKDGDTRTAIVTFEESDAVDTILNRGNTVLISDVSARVERYFDPCEQRTGLKSHGKSSKAVSHTSDTKKLASDDDLSESESPPGKIKYKVQKSLKETTKKNELFIAKKTESDKETKRRRKTSKTDYHPSEDEEMSSLDKLSESESLPEKSKYKTKEPLKKTSKKKEPSVDQNGASSKKVKSSRKGSKANDHSSDDEEMASNDDLSLPEMSRNKNKSVKKTTGKKEPSLLKKTGSSKESKLLRKESKENYQSSDDELVLPFEVSDSDSPPDKLKSKTRKILKETSPVKKSYSGSKKTTNTRRKGSTASAHVTNDEQTASCDESSESESLTVKSNIKAKKEILKKKQSTLVKKATSESNIDTEADYENPWEATIKAKVLDITKSKDFYIYYFEDSSVSQGPFIEESLLLDGLNRNLYVQFHTRKAAIATARLKHKQESNIISVGMATEADFDAHNNLMSVHGLYCSNKVQIQELKALVAERSNMEVIDIIQHDEPRSAIIVFNPETCMDISNATWIFKDSDKVPLILAPVFKTNCLRVTGLKPQSSDDTVKRYFSNRKRSGGGDVNFVQRLSKTEAVVFFKDSFDEVVNRNQHSLEDCELHVSPYFPCLTSEFYKKQIESTHQQLLHVREAGSGLPTDTSHVVHNQRSQVASVPDQTSLPLLPFRVFPLHSSYIDYNPSPKNVEGTIQLCKFGTTFLIRQSVHLLQLMQKVCCKHNCSQGENNDSITLKLDWPHKVSLKEARSKLKAGLDALCEYLDTFRVVQFTIENSQILDFQKFCQMRCRQEMPGVEYFFDHIHNKAVFIIGRDTLSINDTVNRIYHSFLSGKTKPDDANEHNPPMDIGQRNDSSIRQENIQQHGQRVDTKPHKKSGPQRKGKKKNTSDRSTQREDNVTEEEDDEASPELFTIEQESELEEKDVIMFQKTNILKDIEKGNEPIKIILNSESMKAIIKGNDKGKITSAELELLKKAKDFISLNIQSMFSPDQAQLLGKQDIQNKINNIFMEKGYNAHFKCNDNKITLYFVKGVDEALLKDIVNSHVVVKQILLDKDVAFILQSEKGRTFLTELCESSDGVKVSSCVKVQEKHLQIITSSKQLDVLKTAVDRFASQNKSYDKTIPFSPGKQTFVMKYLSQEIEKIKRTLTPLGAKIVQNADNFIVQGLKDAVSIGDQQLSQLREMIAVHDIPLKFFGIKEFLKTDEGKSLVTRVESQESCLILSAADSYSGQGTSTAFKGKQSQPFKPPCLIATTKVGECTLSFMQGDITALDTYAIINPIDGTLKCQSGLGKALISKGGQIIQTELASSNAHGIPGDIIETSAGNLNKCKAIIHVVCPVFTGTEVKALEGAITGCLKHIEQKGLKSVAIPAMGTGKVFKFLPVVAFKLLMKSLHHCLTAESSCLKEIFLCDIQADHVKELIERFKHIFGQEVEEVGQLQEYSSNAHTPSPVPSSVKPARATKDFRHIKVNCLSGEITKQKADVIVVTIGKIMDLNKGGMTRDIVKYGGDAVQQELTDNYSDGIQPGEFGKTSGGKLQCSNIYYARLLHWKGNSDHMMKLVYKLLQSADQQNATTMSIPAIGTGNLGYPPDVAADTITDAICQFAMDNPKSTLKSITLVVYPRDTLVVQAFQSVLSTGGSRGTEAGAGGHGGFSKHRTKAGYSKSEVQFKSVKMSIKKGDITAEKCDAIISGIRDTMDMSNSGAVCKALLKTCGTTLQDECSNKKDEMSQTGFVATSAPNLNCKQIYHVSMDKFSRSWDKCITQVLTHAESQGLTSIALPALGAGSKRADYQRIKKSIFKGVDHFARTSPNSLKDVRLVFYSEDMLDEFMSESDSPKQASFDHKDDSPTQVVPKVSDHADLKIYATSHQKIADASKSLVEVFKKAFREQKEKDKEIKRLNKHQVKQLEDEGLRHCVHVSVSVEEGVIILKGFTADGLMNVMRLLKTLLVAAVDDHHNSIHRAVVSAIKWQFEQGKWRDFEPLLNSEIEAAYKNKSKHHDITDGRGRAYRIDLLAMKEFQLSDDGLPYGQGNNVRRYDRTKEGEPLPKGWASMGSLENLKLVALQPASPEYKSVEQLFLNGGANATIKKIERVQNKSLYQQFKAKKREMDHRNPKGHINEKKLFHGTDAGSMAAINDNGFNRSYCGKNATVYGNGVYFAVNSSYSVGYAKPDIHGTRFMYVARVLTGVSVASSSGMSYLPNKPGTNIPYDSGCNSASAPIMFIIFHDTQAYPEYLITF